MTTPPPRRSYLFKELARHNHTGDLRWVQGALGEPVPAIESLNFGQVECVLHVLKTTPNAVFA